MTTFTLDQIAEQIEHYENLQREAQTDEERATGAERLRQLQGSRVRNGIAKADGDDGTGDGGDGAHHSRSRWAYVPIAELIGKSGIELAPKGGDRLVGGHGQKHASNSGTCLVVWPAESRWWCSSCQEGGGAIEWLWSERGLKYSDAADWLRDTYGQPEDEKVFSERLRGTAYSVRDGRLTWMKTERVRQTEVQTPVTLGNFVVFASEAIRRDDGQDVKLEYVVQGRLDDGNVLPAITVGAEKFSNLMWINGPEWGLAPVLSAGPILRDRTREAVQRLCRGAPVRTIYAATGWRQVDGAWVYCHAGGALGAGGSVDGIEVGLEQDLARYALPSPPTDPQERQAAIRASLALRLIGPLAIMAPIQGTVLGAPLARIASTGYTLWVHGPTQEFKSTLVALASNHVGDFPDEQEPPCDFESTANYLEKLSFLAADLPLWVDDFRPGQSRREREAMEQSAQRLIRGAANRVGRGRMTRTTELQRTYRPRGLPIATGELFPSGWSTNARVFPVEVRRAEIDLERLSRAQQEDERLRLRQAMAMFLVYLAGCQDELRATLPDAVSALRDRYIEHGVPARHARQAGFLLAVWTEYLDFALQEGVVNADEVSRIISSIDEALRDSALTAARHSAAQNPGELFLATLRALLAQRRVYLADVAGDDRPPPGPTAWGWTAALPRGDQDADAGGAHSAAYLPRTGARLIGWVGKGVVYLQPDATLHEVRDYLRNAPVPFTTPNASLYRLLDQLGAIAEHQKGRHTTQKRIGGVLQPTLLALKAVLLVDADGPLDLADTGEDADDPF